jgi:hypothetical protein
MNDLFSRVRAGEIIHLKSPNQFFPIYDFLEKKFSNVLKVNCSLTQAFDFIEKERYCEGLNFIFDELDSTREHYKVMAKCLSDNKLSKEEAFLIITLDKSLRTSLAGRYKKNYGYLHHKDSWFDLAPDGVNIVVYLTDVPYEGNTIFFKKFFSHELAYDPQTKNPVNVDLNDLGEITSFNCNAGDILIFAGDHFHSGPRMDLNRLSIEFRLSRFLHYGRPLQNIYYKEFSHFL